MKSVLIVEDESALQDALKKILATEGYDVVQAFDGEEALIKLAQKKPDIILLDLVLPRKHGFDVLKELKAKDQLKEIPVLVLTNLEESEDVMKAIELGARGYLIKANYSLKDVLAKIKEAVG